MNWKNQVWDQVERFRNNHPCEELSSLPIDALSLAELVLGLDLIIYDDLLSRFGVEAAITADFSGLYVDAETFNSSNRLPVWKENRLRFTIAHEIGHFVMHQEEFRKNGFKRKEEFVEWSLALRGRKYQIEKEANEFAGRLIVPRSKLLEAFATLESKFSDFPRWRESADIRQQAAELLGQRFGMHTKGMLARFTREDVWPEVD